MAKVTVGGTQYEVPELNFIALERSWPFIEEAMTALDPMKGVSAALHIIAAGLVEADNFDPATYNIKPEDISATPRAPPTSRSALLAPEAMPCSSGRTLPITRLELGAKYRAMPTPLTTSAGIWAG